jgi:hypothetical protein
MQHFTKQLSQHLIKNHDVNITNASIMIEDEIDFIEAHLNSEDDIKSLAKELMNIYMVA